MLVKKRSKNGGGRKKREEISFQTGKQGVAHTGGKLPLNGTKKDEQKKPEKGRKRPKAKTVQCNLTCGGTGISNGGRRGAEKRKWPLQNRQYDGEAN